MAYYFSEPSHTFNEYLLVPGYSSAECMPATCQPAHPARKIQEGRSSLPLYANIPMVSAIMQAVSDDTHGRSRWRRRAAFRSSSARSRSRARPPWSRASRATRQALSSPTPTSRRTAPLPTCWRSRSAPATPPCLSPTTAPRTASCSASSRAATTASPA